MKKYNVYYATEENAYEIEKYAADTLPKALKAMKDIVEENEGEFDRNEIKKNVSEHGHDYLEMESVQGYNIVIGIAEEDNDDIDCLLNDYREEFINNNL